MLSSGTEIRQVVSSFYNTCAIYRIKIMLKEENVLRSNLKSFSSTSNNIEEDCVVTDGTQMMNQTLVSED